MNWDQHLERRFACTSHIRLLNQVRSELLAQPLSRDPITRRLKLEAKPSHSYNIRENKRYIHNNPTRHLETNNNLETEEDIANRSFRERLNSIDMR